MAVSSLIRFVPNVFVPAHAGLLWTISLAAKVSTKGRAPDAAQREAKRNGAPLIRGPHGQTDV
jgi:hypothetical protein